MRRMSFAAIAAALLAALAYFSCDKGTDSAKPESADKTDAQDDGTDGQESEPTAAGTVAIETVQKITQITDPVAAFPATDMSEEALAARVFDNVAVSTSLTSTPSNGIYFGQSTQDIKTAFGTAGSKAYCNSVNSAMKFFMEVSNADFNLCILKAVAAKGHEVKAGAPQTWDFKVASGQGAMTYRMKFTIDLTDAGTLKTFENYTCEGQGTNPLSQSGYIKQTITDGQIKVHGRAMGDHGAGSYKTRVDMAGRLGENGHPLGIKTLDYAEEGEGRKVHTTVKQSAANIEAIGYETSPAYEERFIRFVKLLDANAATGQYMITKVGYGDGAALLKTISNTGAEDATVGWTGATLAANASEPRKDKVANRSAELIAAATDKRDIEFASSELYDCAGTADYTFEGKQEDFQDCLAAFQIDQEGSTMCNDVAN